MRYHLIVRIALSAAFLLSIAGNAETATINVTANAADVLNGANASCSLREAITNINNGAATYADCANIGAAYGTSDTINLPAGTYTTGIAVSGEDLNATGDLDIINNVTIAGAGAGISIIDGGGLDRVIHITGAYTVFISGVTIQNGASPTVAGGIYSFGGALTLTNSTIRANTAATFGGGIYSSSTLIITNSTIGGAAPADGNTATANNGGGVYVFIGVFTATGSTIRNNTAPLGVGGGICSMSVSAFTIINSTISDNSANSSGGIFNENATLTITGSTVSGNQSASVSGGISTLMACNITNSTISGNTAATTAGGVDNSRSLTITDSTISGNTASSGGGVYNRFPGAVAATATITRCAITGNTATGGQGGGGVFNTSAGAADTAVITITDTTISGNTGNTGAGIRNDGVGATLSISKSTVSGNTAGAQGGGIRNSNKATLENTTISGNSSTASNGGGVYSTANITFKNCTITNNSAAALDSGVSITVGGTFTNNIIANQASGNDCALGAGPTSGGHNLDSDNSCALLNDPTDAHNALASLGALANNGGSTLTHLPSPSSAALNQIAAGCPATDQRGIARPQGVFCDIGAVELQYLNLATSVTGSGRVTSDTLDTDCPGMCAESVMEGATRTLTATPSSGYTFSGWGGNCAGTAATCNVTMTAAKNVTATFAVIPSSAVPGCMTPNASNYNPAATVDDGSCVYPDPDFGGSGANSLDFGTGAVNSSSQKTITLKNTGLISAYIYRLDISGLAFSVVSDSCSGKAVWKDNTCDIVVSFNPSLAGSFTGTLNVWTNAAKYNPLSVSLVGKATVSIVSSAKLIAPADGATLTGTQVTFEWTAGSDATGAKVTDSAYVCERSDFAGCETPAITSRGMAIPAGLLILLGLMAPFGFRNRRVRSVLLALIFMTAGGATLWACGSDSSSSGQSGKSLTLKADTKYYWKVVTTSANGSEESEARSFTTGR